MLQSLKQWWRQRTGRASEPTPAPSAPRAEPRATTVAPAKVAPGELELLDEHATQRKGSGKRAGGDPYANDAGFAKPHGWERVDHD